MRWRDDGRSKRREGVGPDGNFSSIQAMHLCTNGMDADKSDLYSEKRDLNCYIKLLSDLYYLPHYNYILYLILTHPICNI